MITLSDSLIIHQLSSGRSKVRGLIPTAFITTVKATDTGQHGTT